MGGNGGTDNQLLLLKGCKLYSHPGGLVGKVKLLKHPPLQSPVSVSVSVKEWSKSANESFLEHLSSASMYSQVDWVLSVENHRGLFQPWLRQAGVLANLIKKFQGFCTKYWNIEIVRSKSWTISGNYGNYGNYVLAGNYRGQSPNLKIGQKQEKGWPVCR